MKKKHVLVFGASSDGRRIFRYLNKKRKNIIFLDNDKKKNGLSFLGTKIFHPEKFNLQNKVSEIYLGGRYMDEQYDQLKKNDKFKNIKIIKTDRWKYKPSIIDIRKKEKSLLRMLSKVLNILYPLKNDLIADASTLLGLLRGQNLAYFSDLDFSINQNKIQKLYKLIRKNLSGYKLEVIKYKKNVLNFKKGEINQVIISEKCNLKIREPNIIDISAERKKGNYFLKYDGTKNYSKVPIKFRRKFEFTNYKTLKLLVPLPLNDYIEFCYGKHWKIKTKSWNNSLSKRFVKN